MKCPNCGAESSDIRFYCGACGSELRETSIEQETQAPVNFKIRDIVEHGILLILMGTTLLMIGIIVAALDFSMIDDDIIGPYFRYSEVIIVAGVMLLGVGAVVNLGQLEKRVVLMAVAFEVVSSVVSIVVSVHLVMAVTDITVEHWPTGDVEIKTYGYRTDGILYLLTLGMVPLATGYLLSIKRRYAWVTTLAVSAAEIPLSFLWLGLYFEAGIAAMLSSVQIPVIIALLLPGSRKHSLESATHPIGT